MHHSTPPQSPSRRRLAKGAVGASAVLASLTAKNALAGDPLCAISGKMSTHGSPQKSSSNTSCRAGKSLVEWKAYYAMTGNSSVGCPPGLGDGCKGQTQTVTDPKTKAKKTTVTRASSGRWDWSAATRHQILSGLDDSKYKIADVNLLIAALCVYSNAEKFPADYHITTKDCLDLYKAAANGGSLTRDGITWSSAECRKHLVDVLYFAA